MKYRFSLAALGVVCLCAAPAVARAPQAPWAFEKSDVPLDAGWTFGRLPNGMRYAIRHNELPKGEVVVRLRLDVGSLDETERERGYAHFVEHMAFQGSTHVASGEMVRLLERHGLAFGADTNAFTNTNTTTYHLDLPKNTPELVDTALMLMRETAGELSFPAAQVERERGVVLSEMQVRDTWQQRNYDDMTRFLYPQSRLAQRSAIGTRETLNAANADTLRAFWHQHYVPAKATLVVVGDIQPAEIEAKIRARFGDWPAAPDAPQPDAGPFASPAAERTGVFLDPALSESVLVARAQNHRDPADTLAHRRDDLLLQIGVGIINRRLQHLARSPEPPYTGAYLQVGDIQREGRVTSLYVDGLSGQWRRSLIAATEEYARALEQGFTAAEVAEQLANITASTEAYATRADTRPDEDLVNQALSLVTNEAVPADPRRMLDWLRGESASITPASVMAALKAQTQSLEHPQIRFGGRQQPIGGEAALRKVYHEALATPLPVVVQGASAQFAYQDFGAPGAVVSDTREPLLGVRQIRFANGVRLNLKHTDLAKDQILVGVTLDGGQMLATRDNPLAVELVPMLRLGGLGKHSQDDLQSLLAGHVVSSGLTNTEEKFETLAATRRADLDLQLQLLAAQITDPGYRPEGERDFHNSVNTMLARMRSTPEGALGMQIGGILSDNDPRFSMASAEALYALNFARLRRDISDRLAHGAIEMAIVGDIDEDTAIAAVARTMGALPAREPDFRPYADRRERVFTADHTPRTIYHDGPKDQALVYVAWKTRDDNDPVEKQVLNMLDRTVRIQLSENLRQKLGKTYAPSASSHPSRVWKDYGVFAIEVPVAVQDVEVARKAVFETIAAMRDTAPSPDLMLRARAPLMEVFDATFKSNSGWMAQAISAQSKPTEIDRQLKAPLRLQKVVATDVQAAAQKYLTDAGAVVVTVLPRPPRDTKM